jgi:hypothetical protein
MIYVWKTVQQLSRWFIPGKLEGPDCDEDSVALDIRQRPQERGLGEIREDLMKPLEKAKIHTGVLKC